ncbi:TraK domain-containing protein [Ahniella affigens]|nr:type-F conjugative transfer system secretin TraK [Ahniella affigens]
MRTLFALFVTLALANSTARADQMAVPGLPIKLQSQPAANSKTQSSTTTGTATISQPGAQLDLDDIDRLVAEERARLGTAVPSSPGRPLVAPTVPKPKVDVEFGRTVSISVGLGQVNRFVAPFKAIRIQHQSTATVRKQGEVIYVSPTDTTPFALYIEDQSDPRRTIGLLIRPHPDVPPVQVELSVPGYVAAAGPISRGKAPSHILALRSLLRDLATGEIPPGYSLSAFEPDLYPAPRCAVPGLAFVPSQVVTGGEMMVVIARIENTSSGVLELDEASCADRDVAAIAMWPSALLPPSGSAELMFVYRTPALSGARARPSLVESTE